MENIPILKNPTFCAAMWDGLYIGPDQKVWPCCMYKRNDDITDNSIINNTISSAINSEHLIELRKLTFEGVPIAGCDKCYNDEKNFGNSARLTVNCKLKGEKLHKIKQLAKNGFVIDGLKPSIIMPIFSNICNQKCRSCNPQLSSKISLEFYNIEKANNQSKIIDFTKKFGSSKHFRKTPIDNPNALNELINNGLFDECEIIRYAGGEPFITEDFYRMIDYLVDSGKSKRIEIEVSTNGSYLNFSKYNALEYLEKIATNFKSFNIQVSIDSSDPDRLAYIRAGAKLDVIESFLSVAFALANQFSSTTLTITYLVTLFNIFDMRKDLEILTTKYEGSMFCVYPAYTPYYLNASLFSLEDYGLNKDADSKVSFLIDHIFDFITLRFKGHDLAAITTFKEITTELDLVRGESYQVLFPKLRDLVDKTLSEGHK